MLHLHVAEQAGKVVGFVVFQVEQAPETPVHVPRQWVIVSLIVVSRDVRSRGIGTELLRHVQAWVMEYGIPEIELQVAEFNTAAIACYEGMGFRSRYRHMGWSVDDEADVPGGSGPDTG